MHPMTGQLRQPLWSRLVRWVLVVAVVAAIGYFGYMGWEGSAQLVHPPHPNTSCQTPGSLKGWQYEAINYDRAADDALHAQEADLNDCASPGAPAGTDVVASDGIKVAGWWIPAAAGIGPKGPTVVLVHGYGDNKSGMLPYAAFLHDRYNLLLFDLRNGGQSSGDKTTQGIEERRDLEAMLDWLVRTKAPQKIVAFGQSMGGQTSINVVAHDQRVVALILDSTHDRLATAMVARIHNAGYPLGEVGYLAIALGTWIRTGENVLSEDPIEALPALVDRPVLLLQGGSDIDVPPASADRMAAAARAAGVDLELHVCAPATHGHLDEECPADYGKWLNDFMARALGG